MKTFRVMQFNMQFGQVWDDADPDRAPVRIGETLAEIRRQAPDILLLQELEQVGGGGAAGAGGLPANYAALRAGLPEYDSVYALPEPDERELPFGVGLAIFSRTPLRGLVRHVLPSPPIPFHFEGRELTPTDRLLIGATTELQGRRLNLFNVHLLAFFMLNTSGREHPEQRKQVLALMERTQHPALIGGDFNAKYHGDLVEQFAGIGYQPVQTSEVTWRRRPYVLDHIFHDVALRCEGCRVVPTPASDHHVLLADLAFA